MFSSKLRTTGTLAAILCSACTGAPNERGHCSGAKCDDVSDRTPAAPGTIRDAALVDCSLDPDEADPEGRRVLLECHAVIDHYDPIPVTEVGAIVAYVDGTEETLAFDGMPATLPEVPERVTITASLDFVDSAFVGLDELQILRREFAIEEETRLHLTLPFDLWPVEVTNRDPNLSLRVPAVDLDLAPATDGDGKEMASIAEQTLLIDQPQVVRLYLPVERGRLSARSDAGDEDSPEDNADAGTGPDAGGKDSGSGARFESTPASEFQFPGPGFFIAENQQVRPASFDDLAARLCVPPTIMMHSKDVDRQRTELIPHLQEKGYTTITLQDLSRIVRGQLERPAKPVILTIDDVPTDFIRSQFRQMVDDILGAEMTVSLAVNTTAPADSDNPNHQINWERLRGWQQQGVSLESHGSEHLNMSFHGERCAGGSKTSCDMLEYLIEDSINELAENTARRPSALITPFGIPRIDDLAAYASVRSFARRAGADFIVGIPAGREITPATDSRGQVLFLEYPLFVGRVEIQETVAAMEFELERWYRNTPNCAAFEIADNPGEGTP